MNADPIVGRILEDAKTQALQTLTEAQARAEQVQVESDQALVAQREDSLIAAKAEAQEMRDRMLRTAALDTRKLLLAMKRETLDQTLGEALTLLVQLPAATKRSFAKRMLLKTAQGTEELIISKDDTPLYDAAFFAEVNAELSALGRKGALRLAGERREMHGGFVLRQGDMEINCSYAAMLAQERPQMEAAVAGMLFKD